MNEQKYSDEELLEHLRELANDNVGPTFTKVVESDGPSRQPYLARFGSITNARNKAGLDHPVNSSEEYTKEECIEWIQAFVEFFNCVPREADMQAWPGPNRCTLRNKFGSVADAVKEAGYEPVGEFDE